MCGIAGYFSREIIGDRHHQIVDMARSMRRRGPDDEGYVLINTRENTALNLCGPDSDPRIRETYSQIDSIGSSYLHDLALAHRRFSIIDLSANGHQPMWDAEEQVCVSFYGEIYNYVELRKELEAEGARFRSQSDTEVVLQAYLRWGPGALERFNGPFAMAMYDRSNRKVLLCRDRIGKATLYYTVANGCLYWATEMKAFLVILGSNNFSVRDQAVHDFVYYGIRDFDGTFWNEIHDFPPASYAWIKPDLSLEINRYWKIPQSRQSTRALDAWDASEELASLLSDAVRIRTRADVPVAFELSGGMDSSTTVALAAANLSSNLTAFTVKYPDPSFDEEPYARAVAERHMGKIDHRVLAPEKEDFWRFADEFVWTEEEPFHSPNLQTNQQLRRLMSEDGYRVVISGAAGDEVFAGYWSEYLGPFLAYLLGRGNLAGFYRELLNNSESSAAKSACLMAYQTLCPRYLAQRVKILRLKRKYQIGDIYMKRSGAIERSRDKRTFSQIMMQNMGPWKMNYWVRSGSKANYGIPIEARVPFLDYRIVDFAFRLPPEYLIHDGWHKWILRTTMKDLLPGDVVWREKKMGFPFPLPDWLVHSKRTVFENLADLDCPYVRVDRLQASYDRLANSAPDVLWRLVSLCLWWRKVIEGREILNSSAGHRSVPVGA